MIRKLIAQHKLNRQLKLRKLVRQAESERSKQAYLKAQRKLHAADPLRKKHIAEVLNAP